MQSPPPLQLEVCGSVCICCDPFVCIIFLRCGWDVSGCHPSRSECAAPGHENVQNVRPCPDWSASKQYIWKYSVAFLVYLLVYKSLHVKVLLPVPPFAPLVLFISFLSLCPCCLLLSSTHQLSEAGSNSLTPLITIAVVPVSRTLASRSDT